MTEQAGVYSENEGIMQCDGVPVQKINWSDGRGCYVLFFDNNNKFYRRGELMDSMGLGKLYRITAKPGDFPDYFEILDYFEIIPDVVPERPSESSGTEQPTPAGPPPGAVQMLQMPVANFIDLISHAMHYRDMGNKKEIALKCASELVVKHMEINPSRYLQLTSEQISEEVNKMARLLVNYSS